MTDRTACPACWCGGERVEECAAAAAQPAAPVAETEIAYQQRSIMARHLHDDGVCQRCGVPCDAAQLSRLVSEALAALDAERDALRAEVERLHQVMTSNQRHAAEAYESLKAELAAVLGCRPEDRPQQLSCMECDRRLVWSRSPGGPGDSWMCPHCVLERMDAAEKCVGRIRTLAFGDAPTPSDTVDAIQRLVKGA